MKFVMFTINNPGGYDDGAKIAVNRDQVKAIIDNRPRTIIYFVTGPREYIEVEEDFATVHSRLNILEG